MELRNDFTIQGGDKEKKECYLQSAWTFTSLFLKTLPELFAEEYRHSAKMTAFEYINSHTLFYVLAANHKNFSLEPNR